MTMSQAEAVPATWTGRRFGGLPTGYWVLFAGMGIARVGWFVIPFRVFYLSHERQLHTMDASLVIAAFGAGWALSQPFGGLLADTIGRKTAIIAGTWSTAAAFLAFGSARTLVPLAVAAFATGLSFEIHRPAAQALTTDTAPAQCRARALALLYLTMNVGRGVACITAGLLAGKVFWLLFAICSLANIGFGIAVQAKIENCPPDPRAHTRPMMRLALADPILLAFTAITLIFYSILLQSAVTLPVVLDQTGASPAVFGLVLGLGPLTVAAAQLLLQSWLTPDAGGGSWRCSISLLVCALAVATVGIGLAITGTGTTVAWFAATTPIWVIGEVAFLAVAPGVVASLAPAHLRATYFGLWGCCQGVAAISAPLLSAILIDAGGTDLLWTAGAATGALTAAACLILRASAHRRFAATAQAQAS